MHSKRFLPVVVAGLLLAGPLAAQPSSNTVNTLPPALRAAVQSGNSNAVTQAINTLSGGNAVQAASLAAQVVAAAEQLLSTNPQAAFQAAGAAVEAVRSTAVQSGAPGQTVSVLTTAARIFTAPAISQIAPGTIASLANAVLQVASSTNNPTLIAATAQAAVTVATRTAATNPAGAAQLSAAAMSAVQSPAVTSAAPQVAAQVATSAAAVVANPNVQQAAPQASAQVATSVAQVMTTPAVYQVNPQAAVAAMSSAYSTASSQSVAAAAPTAVQTVTQTLNTASANGSLSQSNSNNSAQINAILSGNTSQKSTTNNTITTPINQVVRPDESVSPSRG